MGIHGLTRYCDVHRKNCSTVETLENVVIGIDYEALLYFCCNECMLHHVVENSLSDSVVRPFYGMDPQHVYQWLCDFFQPFLALNNRFILVQDPPKYLLKMKEMKACTWTDRKEQKQSKQLAKREEVMKVLRKNDAPMPASAHKPEGGASVDPGVERFPTLRPPMAIAATTAPAKVSPSVRAKGEQSELFPLARAQLQQFCAEFNFPILCSSNCEAEEFLAILCRQRKLDVVFSQDSDLYIMKDIRYCPLKHITPRLAQVRIYRARTLAACMNLPPSRLVDISILCGNDFSRRMFQNLHMHEKVPGLREIMSTDPYWRCRSIERAIKWIRRQHFARQFSLEVNLRFHSNLSNDVEIQHECECIDAFYGYAVSTCRMSHEDLAFEDCLRRMHAFGFPKFFFTFLYDLRLRSTSLDNFELLAFPVSEEGPQEQDAGQDEQIQISAPFPTLDDLLVDMRHLVLIYYVLVFSRMSEFASFWSSQRRKENDIFVETLKHKSSNVTSRHEIRFQDIRHSSLPHASSLSRFYAQLLSILDGSRVGGMSPERAEMIFQRMMCWLVRPSIFHVEQEVVHDMISPECSRIETIQVYAITGLAMSLHSFIQRIRSSSSSSQTCASSQMLGYPLAHVSWLDLDMLLLALACVNRVCVGPLSDQNSTSPTCLRVGVLTGWFVHMSRSIVNLRFLLGLLHHTPPVHDLIPAQAIAHVLLTLVQNLMSNASASRTWPEILAQVFPTLSYVTAWTVWRAFVKLKTQVLGWSSPGIRSGYLEHESSFLLSPIMTRENIEPLRWHAERDLKWTRCETWKTIMHPSA